MQTIREQNAALVARLRAGDASAGRELVTASLGLLHWMAGRYSKLIERDEAISVGAVALLRVAHRWDPARGAWSTFVVPWLRSAVVRHARRANAVVARGLVLSLDAPTGEEGGASHHDLIADPEAVDPEDEAGATERRERVRRHVARLPAVDRQALARLLEGGQTLDQAAEAIGLERGCLGARETAAVRRLAASLAREDARRGSRTAMPGGEPVLTNDANFPSSGVGVHS